MFMIMMMFALLNYCINGVRCEIYDLDSTNFHIEIDKHGLALVIFYAPWCGQCKRLMLHLPEIDAELQKLSPPIDTFRVNCEEGGSTICKEYNIGGYPILKSFQMGKEYGKFDGIRDANNILNFMKTESMPIVVELDGSAELNEVLYHENRVCLVAKFRKRSKMEVIFRALAEKFRRKMSFLYIYGENDTWIKMYQNPLFWSKLEQNYIEYEDDEDISKLKSFIEKNFHGSLGFRTALNKNDFKEPLVTAYFNVDFEKNLKTTNYWRNRILKVAKKYMKHFNFAISSRKEFLDEISDFGLEFSDGAKPIIVVKLESNEKYILKDNFSIDTFDEFLQSILNGELAPFLKSQEPPKDYDSDVVIAVGSTFYDLVLNNTNDTMVKLFAKWCGHCERLAPTYRKLAKMLKIENITFIEIDAVQNDVPVAYTPIGYPTIYWSTNLYRMSPIRYQGDRSIEDFIKFIAKHSTNELRDYDREGKRKTLKTEL